MQDETLDRQSTLRRLGYRIATTRQLLLIVTVFGNWFCQRQIFSGSYEAHRIDCISLTISSGSGTSVPLASIHACGLRNVILRHILERRNAVPVRSSLLSPLCNTELSNSLSTRRNRHNPPAQLCRYAEVHRSTNSHNGPRPSFRSCLSKNLEQSAS